MLNALHTGFIFKSCRIIQIKNFRMSELDDQRKGDHQISKEGARQENCSQSTMKPVLSFSLDQGHRKSIINFFILLYLTKYKYDGLLYTRNLTLTLCQKAVSHKASFLPLVASTDRTFFCIIYRGLTTTQLPHKIFLHCLFWIDLDKFNN
jgi:hypothetical protein